MAAGRVGLTGAQELASAPSLGDALRELGDTPYRRGVEVGSTLAEAQRGVSAASLWQLRVLAGWQPRAGASALRLLCAQYEIANAEQHLRELAGAPPERPYRLGALATAWPRLSRASSPTALRAVLATTVWGDPGADTPAAIGLEMRLSLAARTAANLPQAVREAAGEAALLVAREVFVAGRPLEGTAVRHAARVLGHHSVHAASYREFRSHLPATARWAVDGVEEVADLWRAEAGRQVRAEQHGAELLHGAGLDIGPVVGAALVLSVDAWRIRAALESAARGGAGREVFDALMG
ncbi:hypothetical protein [Streptomyces sp. NPDC053560]|uniref:hypothetical protein n=1 Tax=Streptomyces sp. NPDC053560 TaxID=3365711 RepID=UPI0037D2BAA5